MARRPDGDTPRPRHGGRWKWLLGGSMQRRRALGRRYVLGYASVALIVSVVLLAWILVRYFSGTLHGEGAFRAAGGAVVSIVFAAIMILVARRG